MRVKICGVRSLADLQGVLAAGPDGVGFILGARHRTEDAVSPHRAAELVAALPPFVSSVMVTHLQEAAPIVALALQVRPTTLQLHDAIPPGAIQALRTALPGLKLIQAIHVVSDAAIAEAVALEPFVDALLLDSRTADRIGGTGQTHDWRISRRIVEACTKPVILAGGLTPANLASALAAVGPAGVDVNSGVETAAGDKDPERVRAFVRLCRAHPLSALA
ncbi:MAG: phosphoribosylanthranilate isomerase [Cyanobacteriota bacterium]|jgi:phosphoribosylanthranilate isomerase|nr:phosphoribosylanthranilate isomerase [Cyanobacteriota bacterium]